MTKSHDVMYNIYIYIGGDLSSRSTSRSRSVSFSTCKLIIELNSVDATDNIIHGFTPQ